MEKFGFCPRRIREGLFIARVNGMNVPIQVPRIQEAGTPQPLSGPRTSQGYVAKSHACGSNIPNDDKPKGSLDRTARGWSQEQ